MKMIKEWKIIDVIKWAEAYLDKKGFENPKTEIEWLLGSLLGYSRLDLYLKFDEYLTKQQLATLKIWIKRRLKNEPLQYITQSCNFYGRSFFVNSDVFIPRPETEVLVDVAIEKLKKIKFPKILDICTGTGCIASTLALEFPDAEVHAIDNSPKAIKIAEINKSNLSVGNVFFILMNILKESPSEEFDLIISNPPYIPKNEMSDLMLDVREYEPHSALTDYNDGLTFYRRLSKIGHDILNRKGWIINEVGLGAHPAAARNIFDQSSCYHTEMIKDYNGNDRILAVQM